MSTSHTRSRRAQVLAAGALCALVSACGSTVGAGQVTQSSGGLGLAPEGGPSSSTSSQGGSAASTLGQGPTTSPIGGVGLPAATGQPTDVATTPTGGIDTSALSPKTFEIGLQYSSNGGATLGAIGGKNVSTDTRTAYSLIIAWINKHGGIAGRPAVPVYTNVDSTASPQNESEVSCASWTQDHHVAVGVPASAVEDNNDLRACLGKHQTPALYGNLYSSTSRASFNSSPLWFEGGSLPLEDYAKTLVGGLAGQGFFTGGKVGVVYFDGGEFTSVLHSSLLPALSAAGVKNPATFAANIDGASQISSGSTQMSNAVLRFRSLGVNRVLFFEPWPGYFEFLNVAKSQGYNPTYGLSTQDDPEVVIALGLAPAADFDGSYLVSWMPDVDVADASKYLGPMAATCRAIFKAAGSPIPSGVNGAGLYLACEDLFTIQAAYRNAPTHLTPNDFTQGMQSLGAKVPVASRPAGIYSTNNHWGTSEYRVGRFNAAAKSFLLSGPPHAVL